MPTPSRRAMIGALAAAPVAGLPMIAVAASPPCPALAAAREYRRLKVIEQEAWRLFNEVDEPETEFVEINGERVFSVLRLDAMFNAGEPMTEAEVESLHQRMAENVQRWIQADLESRRERGPLPPEYFAAREKLDAIDARRSEHPQEQDEEYKAVEDGANGATDAAMNAAALAFQAPAASREGAIAVLRIAVDLIEETGGINDTAISDCFLDGMRRAIDRLAAEA